MPTQVEKCAAFAALHGNDQAFIIPNPWDVGSARLLEGLGFRALATTSAGFAMSRGGLDGSVTLADKLQHCRDLAAATRVPINVDFENAFAESPEEVANNILRLAATGVAGCSIEDWSRDQERLYERDEAADRVQAAVEAVASLDCEFQLTARCENFLHGVKDLDDTIERLQAYSAAGAQVLYAPGLTSLEQVKQVKDATDKPLNVLGVNIPDASLQELRAAGATRVSVGGALAWVQFQALYECGRAMLDEGRFDWVSRISAGKEIRRLLE